MRRRVTCDQLLKSEVNCDVIDASMSRSLLVNIMNVITTLVIPTNDGGLIVCGKLVKVIVNFLCYEIIVIKSARKHCSSSHCSL